MYSAGDDSAKDIISENDGADLFCQLSVGRSHQEIHIFPQSRQAGPQDEDSDHQAGDAVSRDIGAGRSQKSEDRQSGDQHIGVILTDGGPQSRGVEGAVDAGDVHDQECLNQNGSKRNEKHRQRDGQRFRLHESLHRAFSEGNSG